MRTSGTANQTPTRPDSFGNFHPFSGGVDRAGDRSSFVRPDPLQSDVVTERENQTRRPAPNVPIRAKSQVPGAPEFIEPVAVLQETVTESPGHVERDMA